jgi:DNA polymerase
VKVSRKRLGRAAQILRLILVPPTRFPRERPFEVTVHLSSNLQSTSLGALRQVAMVCRQCPLWKNATQTVSGEGPNDA